MFYQKRTYRIVNEESIEELANKLVSYTWTGCTGFKMGNVLYLNDSTGPDGAQEYAVVRLNNSESLLPSNGGDLIESITFSWCTSKQATDLIRNIHEHAAQYESFSRVVINIDLGPAHRCGLCA